jgi:hypothetical protein
MSSIPLPALDIKQQPDPLSEYAKALSVKNMIGQGQEQQQQIQLTQAQIDDQKASTSAMQQWDGKNWNDLPGLIKQNGGSAQAVWGARSKILEQQKSLSQIAADDATANSKNIDAYKTRADQIAGRMTALDDIPDAQLPTEAKRTVNSMMADGLIDAPHGQQLSAQIESNSANIPALRQSIDEYAKMHMGASEQAANAKSVAESGKAAAEANLANQKIKLYSSSKPGDFDKQIDQLVPPAGPNNDLNQQTKTLVNGFLGRADYEDAAKALENAQHAVNQRTETNFVQNREDGRAAMARQAGQSNQLQKNGLEQLDKVWTDPQHGYTQFLAQANATKTAVADAKNGNELAASLAPLMTVLGVNSFAGVHRINPQEYAAAGPNVGSLYRQINTALDKAGEGKLNPDTAKEMGSLVDGLIQAKHASLVPASQLITRNAGLDPKQTTIFSKEGQPATLDDVVNGRVQPQQTQGGFKVPNGAPPATGIPDGHQLKQGGKVIAVAKGGQWVAPTPPSQ